jgi:hypothetical protein
VAQVCLVAEALALLIAALLPPVCYTQDLQQEYLSARAWRDGVDIFTPVTELSARYFPAATESFPHPNPHPPFLILFAIPFSFLPFPLLVFAWLAFNVALLIPIGRRLGLGPLGALTLTAWLPVWCVLRIGQQEIFLLWLLLLAWQAARAGADRRAGTLLGICAAMKLYPALFLVPFAARRRGTVVLFASFPLLASQIGNLAVAGLSGTVRYYTEILPEVSGMYAKVALNSSPHGTSLRLFGGANDVLPLFDAPQVVIPLTVLLSVIALFALIRLEPEAAPVAVLVALPTVWYYSVVLALPQLVCLVRSRTYRAVTFLVIAGTCFVLPLVGVLMQFAAPYHPPPAIAFSLQSLSFVGLLMITVMQTYRPRREDDVATSKTKHQSSK